MLGGLAGFLIVGLIAGLITSSVVLSNQINSITYTNYSWVFDQSNASNVVDWSHIASATNNQTIVMRRSFSVSKFPTYQRVELLLGGFLGSADNTQGCLITIKDAIEPPYTWPLPTGSAENQTPSSAQLGFTPNSSPVLTNQLFIFIENGSRDVTFAFNGDGTLPNQIIFAPFTLGWTIYSNGTIGL